MSTAIVGSYTDIFVNKAANWLTLEKSDTYFTRTGKVVFGSLTYSALEIAALIETAVSCALVLLIKPIDFFIPKQYSWFHQNVYLPIASNYVHSINTTGRLAKWVLSYFTPLHINGYRTIDKVSKEESTHKTEEKSKTQSIKENVQTQFKKFSEREPGNYEKYSFKFIRNSFIPACVLGSTLLLHDNKLALGNIVIWACLGSIYNAVTYRKDLKELEVPHKSVGFNAFWITATSAAGAWIGTQFGYSVSGPMILWAYKAITP